MLLKLTTYEKSRMIWGIRFILDTNTDEKSLGLTNQLDNFLNSQNYDHGNSLDYLGIRIYILREDSFEFISNKLDGSKPSISYQAKEKKIYVRRRIVYEDFKNAPLKEQQLMLIEAIKSGISDLANYKRLPKDIDINKLMNDAEEFLQHSIQK